MPHAARAILLGLFTLSSAIWVGGYVAIAVVARVAVTTLNAPAKVAFFRALGRTYGVVASVALVVMLGTGAGLMTQIHWGGTAYATAGLAVLLVVVTVVGVAQARRMTRLRRALLDRPTDEALAARIDRDARAAAWLRALIGLLTLVLIALGSALAG
ncbi:hypothetical protein [Leekyejoonella antrihumi]|uniref:DUF1772 domain-containing protein n=1 Tax=Leekyejoonella antrihumi TaxID=1660198 RepID=A0A563E1D7_9MICO|nr:hypothetical protein [Leekyejoonella antrihumi]TWP36053.1 hypothetical protein FGL98_11420 [Leekyejoonella antrihumi]